MKSWLAYCVAYAALTTFLIMWNASLWLTLPLGFFALWWTFVCTRLLWDISSFRISAWRAHLRALKDLGPRNGKHFRWLAKRCLADPKLETAVDLAKIGGTIGFPALLWLPLILWVLMNEQITP